MVSKKELSRVFRKGWVLFSKKFSNSKQQPISTLFQKEYGIVSHTAKKLQARLFLQNCLSEKAPGSKKYFSTKIK